MKRIAFLVLAIMFASTAHSQKSKELQVLIQQIAKLKLQYEYVKKGYEIAQDGLTTIGNWTNGEFALHKDHFKSLRNVNPSIRNMDKAEITRELISTIDRQFSKTRNEAAGSGMFAPQEIQYFKQVYDNLMLDCRQTLTRLNDVTTNNRYEMTDDQRMRRIEELHARMTDNYMFTQSFCGDIKAMQQTRARHKQEIDAVRQMFGSN